MGGGQAHVPGWAADAGKANTGKSSSGSSYHEKQRMYRHPLPLLDVPPHDEAVFARLDTWHREKSKAPAPSTWWDWLAGWTSAAARSTGFRPRPGAEDKNGSLPSPVVGHYDPMTRSVWVTDPHGAQVLWRRGFFGKGSLSRSEPTWLERLVHTRRILAQRAAAQRAGQPDTLTAEELTAVRRRERLQAKIERARAAVRAGTQRPDGILSLGGELTPDDLASLQAAGAIVSQEQQQDGQKIWHVDESLSLAFTQEEDWDQEPDDGYRAAVPGLIYFRGADDAQKAIEARAQARAQAGLEPASSMPATTATTTFNTDTNTNANTNITPSSLPTPALPQEPPRASTPPPPPPLPQQQPEQQPQDRTFVDAPSTARADADQGGRNSEPASHAAADPSGPSGPSDPQPAPAAEDPVENVEWVQLSMIEVFFLAGMLGVLEVQNKGCTLRVNEVFDLCLSVSAAPSVLTKDRALLASATTAAPGGGGGQEAWWRRPDNPFLINYVAYHHYRSLGWCVKPGTKFCVDFLLYKRGPVFGHAEYVSFVFLFLFVFVFVFLTLCPSGTCLT